MTTTVSVIVPVHDAAQTLKRCVDSIVGQTYPHLEIILVDDGSTDGSAVICDNFVSADSRVTVRHTANRGVSSARNTGLDLSSPAGYVTFVDSDDFVAEDMVEKLIAAQASHVADIVIGGHRVVDARSGDCKLVQLESELHMTVDRMSVRFEEIRSRSGLVDVLHNNLYRMELIRAHGLEFDPAIALGEDTLFNMAYLAECRSYSVIDSVSYTYVRYHSKTSLSSRFTRDYFEIKVAEFDKMRTLFKDSKNRTNFLNSVDRMFAREICLNVLRHYALNLSIREVRFFLRIAGVARSHEAYVRLKDDLRLHSRNDKIVERLFRYRLHVAIFLLARVKLLVEGLVTESRSYLGCHSLSGDSR